MQEIKVWMIDYEMLNLIVSYIYGKPWDFVKDQRARNDTYYLFQSLYLWEHRQQEWYAEISLFKEQGTYAGIAEKLLADMIDCRRMPPGSYLVRVAWGNSKHPQQNFWLQHLKRVKNGDDMA